MLKKRRQRGATMGMVAAVTIVFVLLGVFVIFLVKLLGGGEQMQRSADSGNLQLTRAELDQFTVPVPNSGDGLQFNGASDHTNGGNGVIDLRNVNNVLGQSFLVNVNAYVMAQQGVDNGATQHAMQTTNAANSLTSALATTMANATNAFNSYTSVSKKMPTEEFGFKNTTSAGAPKFSYLDRGLPSSVFINPMALADYNFLTGKSPLFQAKAASWTSTVSSASDYSSNVNRVNPASPNQYLLGYIDGMTPGGSFPNTYFVPLRPGARPHLVAKAAFDANTVPNSGTNAFNWSSTNAVANAVSQAAVKQDSEAGFAQFAAYGQMEPIDANGTGMSIHHGFIRLQNGAPSPASGFAAGNNGDVFVFTMQDPQYYALSGTNSTPVPYFVGNSNNSPPLPYGATTAAEYIAALKALPPGQTPNCSGFSVGYALAGDTIGLGGVSQANCANITGISSSAINNIALSTPGSAGNSAMHAYNSSDLLGYYARPLLEAAYNLQPAQATGSNGQSVSVGDIINLALLSARAQGNNFTVTAGQYNSGIAYIPQTRGPLTSPNFKIAAQPEAANLVAPANLNTQQGKEQGIKRGGPVWNFLSQRCSEIDPLWTNYAGDLNYILGQAQIPMAGRAVIYYSSSGNGGKGGLVMKEQSAALLDAPWLSSFISQAADGKAPTSPSEVKEFQLVAEGGTGAPTGQTTIMIDVDGDWGYPHPFDGAPNIGILNWYSFTPSSGYNNLLGEINMGAVNTYGTTPSGGSSCPTTGSSYILNSGAGAGGSDTVTIPNGPCGTTTIGTGPC